MPRRIVDLTRPLSSRGADGAFVAREFEREGAGHTTHHRVEMDAGVGTHVVAPRRLFSWGVAIGDLPVERFFGEGVVARLDPTNVEREIGAAKLEQAVGDRLQRGDIVVLAPTGDWDQEPRLSSGGAQWLETRGAKLVAIDERIKLGSATEGFRERNVLMSFLQSDVPIVLGVTNTDQLSDERLAIMALPAAADGLDAWPVRLVALDPGQPPGLAPAEEIADEADGTQPEDEGMEFDDVPAEQETGPVDAGGTGPAPEAEAVEEETPGRATAALDAVEGEVETSAPEPAAGDAASEPSGEATDEAEEDPSARTSSEP
jgi:kynurenine formamidase